MMTTQNGHDDHPGDQTGSRGCRRVCAKMTIMTLPCVFLPFAHGICPLLVNPSFLPTGEKDRMRGQ